MGNAMEALFGWVETARVVTFLGSVAKIDERGHQIGPLSARRANLDHGPFHGAEFAREFEITVVVAVVS
jgi:hypothetical protein